ncbi:MAG: hypothetical protein K5657_08385 [Desulfovibrio sp.]|nr:hypothetical protein [Desulfovibrio sp.]
MFLDDRCFSLDGTGAAHLAAVLTCASCAQLSASTEDEAIERSRRIFEQHYAYILSKNVGSADAYETPILGKNFFQNKKKG